VAKFLVSDLFFNLGEFIRNDKVSGQGYKEDVAIILLLGPPELYYLCFSKRWTVMVAFLVNFQMLLGDQNHFPLIVD
jgi:hypothetical protein